MKDLFGVSCGGHDEVGRNADDKEGINPTKEYGVNKESVDNSHTEKSMRAGMLKAQDY
jgi:hypothetical protein